jgi:DNA-binding response OmpR family regulator
MERHNMDTLQGKKPVILLIEADDALRRLIVLGLQNRNMHVIEASSAEQVPTLNVEHLDMLVLDVDGGIDGDWSVLEAAQSHPLFSTLPIVVLCWEDRLPMSANRRVAATTLISTSQMVYLAKPFDARLLHDTIDQLLAAQAAERQAREARAEQLLLADYNTTHTASSPWPVVTAVGLLLAVIGFMLQIILAAIGIIVVIVALLLWTLGGKSEPCLA